MGKLLDIRNFLAAFSHWVLIKWLKDSFNKSCLSEAVKESTVGDFIAQFIGFLVAIFLILPAIAYQAISKILTKIMQSKIR